jgi:hypothetical protein
MTDLSKFFTGKFGGSSTGAVAEKPEVRRASAITVAQPLEEDNNAVDEDESIVIRDDTGIIFCEEILKVSNGLRGLRDTFSRMDSNGNGYISLYELSAFLKHVGMKLDLNEIKAIHKYLRGDAVSTASDGAYCLVATCPERIEELVRKYDSSKKAFFFSTRSAADAIPDSQRYFQRFTKV